MATAAALEIAGLRKQFGPTVALDGVSWSVRPGEVHALLGENGAGKSTLVKLLSGLARPDRGEIAVAGRPVRIAGPRDAHALGIRTAFQEISLVKDLTVAQNFLLMEEPLGLLGLVRRSRAEAAVRDRLDDLGLGAIDPQALVADLDLPTRQKIEIARAISRDPSLLLLDEPTASLSSRDVQWLGDMIGRLKRSGTTTIFISHRLQEVREFCSDLSILRNGRMVGSYGIDEVPTERIIELMIGRSLDVVFPARPAPAPRDPQAVPELAVDDLATAGGLDAVSFALWPGEILGVGGLEGMGQRELFLALFGAGPATAGRVSVRGSPVALRSPADAVRADIGISLVPEDRKTEGLFLELDARENVSLPSLGRFLHAGLVDRAAEEAAVGEVLDLVQVPRRALFAAARQFSGGNQQKITIAKWLLAGSRILLLYDPTRGVDVGTKAEIYRLMRRFTDAGGAVLFYSTDIAELVNLCDRVLVLYRGRIAEHLAGASLSDTAIMRAAVGQSATDPAAAEQAHGHRVP
jgi:ribose transport system ATP-binding protein